MRRKSPLRLAADAIESREYSLYGTLAYRRGFVSLSKKELRAHLRGLLATLPVAAIQDKSRAAAARLFKQPEYQRAEVLMIYLATRSEADTTAIVLQAWKDRKRVLAPQVGWETRRMIPMEISNLDTDLAQTQYGLREPTRGTPVPVELIDLVIVPGLGFDGEGNRLGRGRGFYDAFLSRPKFKGTTCAFGLEEQFVDQIPANDHDVRIDMLVTDQEVRRFKT